MIRKSYTDADICRACIAAGVCADDVLLLSNGLREQVTALRPGLKIQTAGRTWYAESFRRGYIFPLSFLSITALRSHHVGDVILRVRPILFSTNQDVTHGQSTMKERET